MDSKEKYEFLDFASSKPNPPPAEGCFSDAENVSARWDSKMRAMAEESDRNAESAGEMLACVLIVLAALIGLGTMVWG